MIYQRTIKETVEVTGVGLHSGCRVKLALKPSKVNSGIIFVRTDLPKHPKVKCDPLLVNETTLSSTLVTEDKVKIGTVEHLMSALACFGIDNIIIELSAQEIPIMDGSSNSFLYLIGQAGVVEQSAKKRYVKIKQEFVVKDGDKWVKFTPHDGFKVKLTISFAHPLFNFETNTFEIDFAKQNYIEEISRARTFAFMKEIETIRNNGLGQGGTLNNTIVINDDDSVLNSEGLRFDNEFVRHKILDAIGDLYILGYQIIGAFEGYKSGHAVNNKLLRELISHPDFWEYITFSDDEDVPPSFHDIQKSR